MSNTSFGGKKKERKQLEDFKKYVGFFKGTVAFVNPDRQELNKIQGREGSEDDKELKYTGEKEGVRTARISFQLEVDNFKVPTGEIDEETNEPITRQLYLPYSINLKEEVRVSKDGSKIQLINQVGDTQWVEFTKDDDGNYEYDESVLFDSFKHFVNVKTWELPDGKVSTKWKPGAKAKNIEILGDKLYKPALVGESDLADFMKDWLSELDLKDPDTNILIDTNKLFGGNFKELDLVDSEFATRTYKGDTAKIGFVALAYVNVDQDDPEKQHQKIFNKFLPFNFMKFINNGCKMPDDYKANTWNKFMKEVEGEYGPKGDYVLEPLKEYDEEEDFAASKETRPDVTASNSKY